MRPTARSCFILPPYMLQAIAERGDAEDRRSAVAALALTARLRGRRDTAMGIVGAPAGRERRSVFSARHTTTLPGTLVRSEGDPPAGDVEVDEAYEGAGATYDFYERVFARRSLDGRGLRLDATVHYDRRFDNAFWDGRRMVYGDGDGRLFQRFTKSLDVIAHELTHGVTATKRTSSTPDSQVR